ncbi:MAG: hypothetical protein RXO35_04125 [Candidatus Micrarchaeota archaeon]
MKTFRKKPLRKASAKAQSAMEYLMTYGWAILIVAVVLGALYSLGVFNGAAFLGTSCVSASGFYCTNPTLSTGGVLTVTIGQATGITFNNAYLYFVPSGTNFSTSDPGTSIGTLNSGQQVTVSIPLGVGSPYPAAYTLGTPISGYLYLQFTDIYGTTEVNKIATVLTKVTASSSGATFSQPTSIPSGIAAYVPITLTNSQSSATPSPFQQMIQINEGNYANYIAYNGNIANFEFFTQSGQILPAWIESNNSGTLTVWVKLPNGIPASSSLTIYLGFASKTTNLLSSGGTSGIGEAPQLSSTYGQYDDGASVFSLYSNFYDTLAGYSAHILDGSFTPTPTTSPYNSVELMNNAGSSGAYILSPNNINPGNYILQTYWSYSGSADGFSVSLWGNPNTIYSAGGGYSPGMSGGLTYHYEFYTGGGGTPPSGNPHEAAIYSLTGNDAGTLITSASASGEGTYYVYSQIAFYNIGSDSGTVAIYSSSATSTSIANNIEPAELYNQTYQSTASFSSISLSASPILFGAGTGGAYAYIYIYWALMRAYPPNGVMPSVSFSGLSSA